VRTKRDEEDSSLDKQRTNQLLTRERERERDRERERERKKEREKSDSEWREASANNVSEDVNKYGTCIVKWGRGVIQLLKYMLNLYKVIHVSWAFRQPPKSMISPLDFISLSP
jgi:hypothetical protein